jgi:predicted outer membrane repeat protein
MPEPIDHPATTMGIGTIESCTDQALTDAIARGGVIVFHCGPRPFTLTVSSEKLVEHDTVIDGGGLVTLSGADMTRILHLRGSDPPAGPKLTVQNLALERGRAPTGQNDLESSGGAILQEGGTLVVSNSAFRHNASAAPTSAAAGGAIAGHGDTTIVGSVFENNSAANGGAIGVSERSLIIVNSIFEGNAALTQGMNMNGGRGGAVSVISGTTDLKVCGSVMSNNTAHILGGAMFLSMIGAGTATIDRSTFDKNQCNDPNDPTASAPVDGGAARPSGRVGAIYAQGVALKIDSSTISNNESVSLAALFVAGFTDRQVPGSIDLVNVTIANNRCYPRMPVTNTGLGGGLWMDQSTTGHVLNSTIVGNEAQFGAGIIGFSALTIDNSIISNTGLNLFNAINCTDLPAGTAPSSRGGHDLQWPADNASGPDAPCAPGTTFADPMLSDLAVSAGSTATMAPKAGSPALGQGQNCPPADQRGKPRKAPCTLGAFESDL